MAFTWRGEIIKQRVQRAAKEGINSCMGLCVIDAKQDHGKKYITLKGLAGWQNITGTAEGSINIYQYARPEGNNMVGQWGSADVEYFIYLELRFFTLRASSDRNYPKLAGLIQKAFARGA